MNDNDDLERTLERSLAHRSREIDVAPAGLDAVRDRVDRRRNRRRHVAVVGSIAAVAVGAFGFVAVARSGPDTITPAAAPDAPDQQAAWRCTDQLNHFVEGSPAVYFVTCEQVTVDGSAEVFDMPDPTIPAPTGTWDVPATAPPTTSPDGSLVTHTVQAGDTVASIAEHFGVTVDQILELNAWEGGTDVQLPVGEVILIALTQAYPYPTVPAPTAPTAPTHVATTTTSIDTVAPTVTSPIVMGEQRYEIQVGDSLASIAAQFEIALEQLVNYNQFERGVGHVLLPGDEILIPPGASMAPYQSVLAPTTTSTP